MNNMHPCPHFSGSVFPVPRKVGSNFGSIHIDRQPSSRGWDIETLSSHNDVSAFSRTSSPIAARVYSMYFANRFLRPHVSIGPFLPQHKTAACTPHLCRIVETLPSRWPRAHPSGDCRRAQKWRVPSSPLTFWFRTRPNVCYAPCSADLYGHCHAA